MGARTIRRDVDKLRSLGYPVEAAPGVAGGYRLGAGGELPPLLLDDAEAVAVAVGLRTAATGSIAGIEETSVRALAKLEQVLPSRLRRRVSALGDATTSFVSEGPQIDPELLAGIAGACRDAIRVRFAYTAKDDRATQRHTEPCAVVHTGYRWYLVAFDLDRDDWRTFRIDRIRGRLRPGGRGRRRTVPGGDPAAFVKRQIRSSGDSGAPAGQIRVEAPPGDAAPSGSRALRDDRGRRRRCVTGHHARTVVAVFPRVDVAARRADPRDRSTRARRGGPLGGGSAERGGGGRRTHSGVGAGAAAPRVKWRTTRSLRCSRLIDCARWLWDRRGNSARPVANSPR